MNYGGLLLSASGEVLRLNPTAERHLRERGGIPDPANTYQGWTRALRKLLGNRITRSAGQTDFWLPISGELDKSLILYSRRIPNAEAQDPHTIVILLALNEPPEPSASVLQKMFDLTAAEARLAIQMTSGRPLAEVAGVNGITTATARSQLSSIFAKTNTSRQPELVALLARIAILP